MIYQFTRHPVNGPFTLTQRWHERPEAYARFGLAGHNGIDFAGAVGTEIVAPLAGRITEVGNKPDGFGLYVKVGFDLSKGVTGYVILAHLNEITAKTGQVVQAGDRVGTLGNTGNSTGPHLHVGVRIDFLDRAGPMQGWMNPAPFFDALRMRNGAAASPHWMREHPEADNERLMQEWSPPIVVIVNPSPDHVADFMKRNPATLVLWRDHPLSEQHRAAQIDPVRTANEHLDSFERALRELRKRVPDAPDRVLFLGINEWELWISGPGPFVAYNVALIEGAERRGLRLAAGNLGVGWPGNDGVKEAPPNYKPLAAIEKPLLQSGGYWGAHNYFSSKGWRHNWQWWGGSIEACPFKVPMLLTESGLDEYVDPERIPFITASSMLAASSVDDTALFIPSLGNGSGRDLVKQMPVEIQPAAADFEVAAATMGWNTRGWMGYYPSGEAYGADLVAYDRELQAKQPFLAGNAVFTYDFAHPWGTFDIRGAAAETLAAYAKATPKPPQSGTIPPATSEPTPKPPTPPTLPPVDAPVWAAGQRVQTTGRLNVRSEPGTKAERLATTGKGAAGVVIERAGEWYRIDWDDEALPTGWSFHAYLTAAGPIKTPLTLETLAARVEALEARVDGLASA